MADEYYEITEIEPLSLAKLGAVFGFFSGIFGGWQFAFYSPWMIIIAPFTGTLIGFLTAICGAWLYNVLVPQIGAVKIRLE